MFSTRFEKQEMLHDSEGWLKALRIFKRVFITTIVLLFIFEIMMHTASCFMIRPAKEFREMVMVKTAIDFGNLINPYSTEYFSSSNPVNASVYGLLSPLLFSPFVRAAGGQENALLVVELLCLFISIVGVYVFWKLLKEKNINGFLRICGSILFYQCYFNQWERYIDAMPQQLALTIMVILFYCLQKDTNRKQYSPLVYSVLTLALYYTKQYFILAGIPVFIYLLLLDKARALEYLLSGVLIGLLSLLLINFMFPMYFALTIGRAHSDVVFNFNWRYILQQIHSQVFSINFPIYCVTFISVLQTFTKLCLHNIKTNIFSSDGINIDIVCLVSLIIPVVYISTNTGQYAEYFIQLILPFSIIIFISFLKSFTEVKFAFSHRCALKEFLVLIFLLTMTFASINSKFINLNNMWNKDILEQHNQICHKLSKYGINDRILVGQFMSYFCAENGIYCPDYGQNEYFDEARFNRFKESFICRTLFKHLYQVFYTNINYIKTIQRRLDSGYYNVIAIVPYLGSFNESNLTIPLDIYYLDSQYDCKLGGLTNPLKIYYKRENVGQE